MRVQTSENAVWYPWIGMGAIGAVQSLRTMYGLFCYIIREKGKEYKGDAEITIAGKQQQKRSKPLLSGKALCYNTYYRQEPR